MMLGRLLTGALMAVVPAPEAVAADPPCGTGVAVRVARDGGSLDGTSQSGVVLVIRNAGAAACSMPGLPTLRFDDEAGHALAILREPPPGMHPGPVVVPLVLAPGAEASAALHWVSGHVFGTDDCVSPSRIAIGKGPDAPTLRWRYGPLCGEAGKPIPFRQPVLRAGPVPPN